MELDMNAADNTCLNNQGRGTDQARGTATTAREGLSMDASETEKQKNTHNIQKDTGDHSFQMSEARTQKASLFPNFIGLLPMLRGGQQDIRTMKADDAKRVIEALQKEVETLQQEKTAAETKITSLTAELSSKSEKYQRWFNRAEENFAKVKSENSSLRQNNARLEQAWKNTDGDKARLASQFNDVSRQLAKERQEYRQKIAQLYDQNKTLHDKNDTLRQILVPVSEKQVLDADVVQKFTVLRSGIVGLVRQTWVPALKHDVDSLGFSLLQQDLIATELPLTYERLRCIVFFFIHASVFDTQNYFLGHNFENLEQLVQRVERELNKNSPEENDKLIAEWRNATFKATEIFRDKGRRLSTATQDEIWEFLSPFQTRSSDAGHKGKEKLKAICDNAVELGLMIRQMKDNFIVDDLVGAAGKPLSQWEELAEEVESVRVDQRFEPGTIAYVIVGALVKNPPDNPDKILVLEKAEVAVYR